MGIRSRDRRGREHDRIFPPRIRKTDAFDHAAVLTESIFSFRIVINDPRRAEKIKGIRIFREFLNRFLAEQPARQCRCER